MFPAPSTSQPHQTKYHLVNVLHIYTINEFCVWLLVSKTNRWFENRFFLLLSLTVKHCVCSQKKKCNVINVNNKKSTLIRALRFNVNYSFFFLLSRVHSPHSLRYHESMASDLKFRLRNTNVNIAIKRIYTMFYGYSSTAAATVTVHAYCTNLCTPYQKL